MEIICENLCKGLASQSWPIEVGGLYERKDTYGEKYRGGDIILDMNSHFSQRKISLWHSFNLLFKGRSLMEWCRAKVPGGWSDPVVVQPTGPHYGAHALQQPAVVLLNSCGALLLNLLLLEFAAHMTVGWGWSHINSRQGRLYLGTIVSWLPNPYPQ